MKKNQKIANKNQPKNKIEFLLFFKTVFMIFLLQG